jgi:predicted alpha/beta hydrolase family esterase
MASELHIIEVASAKARPSVGNVVFVHGLNGDARRTWTSREGEMGFWPERLGSEFPNIGVWSLGYPAYSTQWRGDAMALPDRARNVLELIRLKRLASVPLVFIAHSLGGLVVKTVLRSAFTTGNKDWEDIGKAVKGVLFLATPHGGSLIASVHNVFRVVARSNETIEDMRLHSPYLEDLNEWFAGNFDRLGLKGHVLREGKTTAGVWVVDRLSARPGIPSIPVIDADADHISICEPTGPDSLIYQTTVDFVRNCLDGQNEFPANGVTVADPVDCIVHIGKVRGPQSWSLLGEVRFTLTNNTARKIHVSSLRLTVIKVDEIRRSLATTTAGPVDETMLFARLDRHSTEIDILPGPHVIDPSGTDGFFLKVEAEEGFVYELRIEAEWQFLKGTSQISLSNEFSLEFPAHSVDGLLRLAERSARTGE